MIVYWMWWMKNNEMKLSKADRRIIRELKRGDTRKYNIFFVIVILISFIFIGLFLIPYTRVFSGGLSNNSDDWLTFGTYLGGVLSPTFSFFSLIAVIFIFTQDIKDRRYEESERMIFKYLEALGLSLENMHFYNVERDENLKGLQLLHKIYDISIRLTEDGAKRKEYRYKVYKEYCEAIRTFKAIFVYTFRLINKNSLVTQKQFLLDAYLNQIIIRALIFSLDKNMCEDVLSHFKIIFPKDYEECMSMRIKIEEVYEN